MHGDQRFDVDVLSPACNFMKNEILVHVVSYKFCDFFQPVYDFIKSETPIQVFSCEFWENFQPVTFSRLFQDFVDFDKFFNWQLI